MQSFESQVQQVIIKNKLLKKKDVLILSFSAGADSVSLLTCLYNLSYKQLILVYFDHQLRDSDELINEKKYLYYYANKFNLKLIIKKIPIKKTASKYKISIETAGHLIRRRLLQHYACLLNAKFILSAHHHDDVIETRIINLLKRSFYSLGLRLINSKDKVNVIRPLYFSKKEQILNYCKEQNLKFSQDSTNEDIKYKRNLIRHNLIPQINKLKPTIIADLNKLHSEFVDHVLSRIKFYKNSHLEIRSGYYYYKCNMGSMINESRFDLNRWVAQVIYKFYEVKFNQGVLKAVLTQYVAINSAHIEKIVESLVNNNSGEIVMLPKNIHVLQHNKHLYFYSDDMLLKTYSEQYLGAAFNFKKLNLKLICKLIDSQKKSYQAENNMCYINTNFKNLSIRLVSQKDKFVPFGRKSEQPVWEYLAKQKLNFLQRKSTVVVCSGNKVAWVVGFCIDDRFKISENDNVISEIKIEPLTDTIKHMISYM